MLILFIFITIASIYFIGKFIKIYDYKTSMEYSSVVLFLFNHVKDTSYDRLVKEKIAVYNASNVSFNENELKECVALYITFLKRYAGKKLLKQVYKIYGTNEEQFLRLVASEISTKIVESGVVLTDFNKKGDQ